MKAKLAVVGLGAVMSFVGFGALTGADAALVNIPAPTASGEGVGVKVGDLVSVGATGATASQSGSAASAAPIAINGKPVLAGVVNSTTSGSGNALDTGKTPLGQVVVAPWSTNVGTDQASSSSALATAAITDLADVAVAPSTAFARWTPGASNSAAVSDGAVIRLGDMTIKVLHAESNSSGKGKTYLVQIQDLVLGRTDANGCMLDIAPVAALGCLAVLGGTGSDASILQALINETNPLGKVVAASATGGAGKVTNVLSAETSRAASPSLLARTGQNILMVFALGLLLAVAGATAMFSSSPRRVVPALVRR
jgi:hypothetical protein